MVAPSLRPQVLKPGRVDNVVTTKGPLPLRLCVSGSVETVRCGMAPVPAPAAGQTLHVPAPSRLAPGQPVLIACTGGAATSATAHPSSPHPLLQVRPASGAAATCVAVRFDSFTVSLGGLPETALSLGWLRPLGYVDTLYLDEELRVSVGDKGGLFVLRRVAERDAAAAPDLPPAAGR